MATATYAGTNYTLQTDPVVGTFPRAAITGGIVYCSMDRVVATTSPGLTLASTFLVGKLPKGAVVLYSIVWPIATATFDAPDNLTAATTLKIGIATDTDLFGDVTDLNTSALPQVVIPVPDGTTYTNTLAPLATDVDVLATSADQDHTNAEGFAIMIFYTVAG